MPIVKEADWQSWVDNNKDPYGKCCVDVARKVMEILDAEPGEFDADKLVMRADKEIKAQGITGFMAGCVASMVSHCHSRGEEFRRTWNLETQIHHEGEKANESGGILNPACLNISKA
jgi:hypothetical protein